MPFYISNFVYLNFYFGSFEYFEVDDLAVVWKTKQKIGIETVAKVHDGSPKMDSQLQRCSPAGTCFCGVAELSSSTLVTIQLELIFCAETILEVLGDFQVDLDS